MSVWRYSTLNRSVHSYSTLFLKHEGQISVEVTGKRRKTMRIKRICRCVDGFGVGTNNEHLTLKLFYCYRLKDFDSCWSVSHFSVVTCWHLYVILGYIIHLSFWVVFFIRGLRYIEIRYIEVLSHTFCIEVRYIGVLPYLKLLRGTASQKFWSSECLNKYRHPLLRII